MKRGKVDKSSVNNANTERELYRFSVKTAKIGLRIFKNLNYGR